MIIDLLFFACCSIIFIHKFALWSGKSLRNLIISFLVITLYYFLNFYIQFYRLPIDFSEFFRFIQNGTLQLNYFDNDNDQDQDDQTQNVHNHSVLATTKIIINEIKQKVDKSVTSFDQFLKYIGTLNEKALKVVNYMLENDSYFELLNQSEVSILYLIFQYISNQSLDKQQLLKDSLESCLADCYNEDGYVCDIGRITRITSCFQSIDESLTKIVPDYIYKKELLDKASIIKKELLEQQEPEIITSLEKLDPDTQDLVSIEQFKKKLLLTLKSEFQTNYVETGLLVSEVVDHEVDSWIEYIV